MMPNSLQGVEIGRIGREIEDFDLWTMIAEPIPHGPVFVIRSVVLNEINFLREVTAQDFLEIMDIGLSVEDFLKMVKESSAI